MNNTDSADSIRIEEIIKELDTDTITDDIEELDFDE